MKKILRTEGKGKTYDCIKTCIDTGAVLVTPYNVNTVERMAIEEFGQSIRAISFSDFLGRQFQGCHNEKLVFDNIETCMQSLAKDNTIVAISLDMTN